MSRADILYVTHSRLGFAKLTLPHLLESGGNLDYRVTVVNNGADPQTQAWLESICHQRLARVVATPENLPLVTLINCHRKEWACDCEFVGKVDDDTVIPVNYFAEAALFFDCSAGKQIGAVAAMHFLPEDIESIAFEEYKHAVDFDFVCDALLRQRWIGECCYLIRRELYEKFGDIAAFPPERGHYWNIHAGGTAYHQMLWEAGYPCGYLFPFRYAKHLDDPRFALTREIAGVAINPRYNKPLDEWIAQDRSHARRLLTWRKHA